MITTPQEAHKVFIDSYNVNLVKHLKNTFGDLCFVMRDTDNPQQMVTWMHCLNNNINESIQRAVANYQKGYTDCFTAMINMTGQGVNFKALSDKG